MGFSPQQLILSVCGFISQIEKFGDPNGIVQFTGDALRARVYNESTEAEGPLNISLSITRREGVMGNITVRLYQCTSIIYQSNPVLMSELAQFNYCGHL